MAGILKVDTLQSDSNLALKIATANVAFIDSTGLNVVGGNLTIGATQFAEGGQVQTAGIADGAITTAKIINGAVTNDKIVSVANTKISGNIVSSQIAPEQTFYGNTVISGTGSFLRLASGTGGIQFGGDTSAANALDDYEEGTWTPTYFGASTAGTTTYVSQTGIYTKVGRLVTVTGRVSISAATGTGQLRIGGLPFTCNATTGAYTAPLVTDVNWGGGTYLILVPIAGETNCEVFYCADDAAIVNQNVTNESQGWSFTFSYNT